MEPDAPLNAPLVTNDAVVLGILLVVLGLVFWTSGRESGFWRRFYNVVPSLLLCYFIPALLATAGVISDAHSRLYFVTSRFLLPAALVLLTVSTDLKGILRLGPKALILFGVGTLGVVIGGPLTILIVSTFDPGLVGGQGPDAVWRGMATLAGSWIGGGANQAAMFEVFGASPRIFSALVAVDVLVANVWMAVLLFAAGRSEAIDQRNRADTRAITELKERIASYQASVTRVPCLADTMIILAIAFGVSGLAHAIADRLAPWIEANAPALQTYSLTSSFFWLVVLATAGGLILSGTRARRLEGVGASRIGSLFIYLLVASIGMKMDLKAVVEQPGLFLVGGIWILFHAILLIVTARLIRAPVFFLAVGSQANIGGAASAPIVASAFHPALAPVGVLLAVLGYALGTYGAWLCGVLMQGVAPAP